MGFYAYFNRGLRLADAPYKSTYMSTEQKVLYRYPVLYPYCSRTRVMSRSQALASQIECIEVIFRMEVTELFFFGRIQEHQPDQAPRNESISVPRPNLPFGKPGARRARVHRAYPVRQGRDKLKSRPRSTRPARAAKRKRSRERDEVDTTVAC